MIGHFLSSLVCYKVRHVLGAFFVNKLMLPLGDFKMNIMKRKLPIVNCNFGLKFKPVTINHTGRRAILLSRD